MSKISGANSLFFKIAAAKAPIAPVLDMPLHCTFFLCFVIQEVQYDIFP